MKIYALMMRVLQYLKVSTMDFITQKITFVLMKMKFVDISSGLKSSGVPKMFIHRHGKLKIGRNFKMNNTIESNPVGRNFQCIFKVNKNAFLHIGDNVGMSGTTIVCLKEITISDNVMIGGNTCIYDTDFHSLDFHERNQVNEDISKACKKSVLIEKNVFIGAHVTILKGVHIGENSIVGACSVVTKNIPKNEIWAGNPAKFIRKL
ncbi:acyltransferase [Sulfurovum sp. XTW-4]|uniref:Acyltransferase n=1 Tax=Sulfurovum xiamenensis TaxID=3019066 RepID=A0ABT7QTY7_9BACT|nr:acyltransferase [Sulfurovum xiamenensis]MDM5264389.1 acyltransferase [Sulfurovum xiamenensis]